MRSPRDCGEKSVVPGSRAKIAREPGAPGKERKLTGHANLGHQVQCLKMDAVLTLLRGEKPFVLGRPRTFGCDAACWEMNDLLLQGAADFTKYDGRIAADHSNGGNHNHENDSQHDGIFGDVLSALVIP